MKTHDDYIAEAKAHLAYCKKCGTPKQVRIALDYLALAILAKSEELLK